MTDARMKDVNWRVSDDGGKTARTVEHVIIAVLMDIRDELKAINSKLGCWRVSNMLDTIPRIDKKLGPLKKRKRR